jgi:hypothetical protein
MDGWNRVPAVPRTFTTTLSLAVLIAGQTTVNALGVGAGGLHVSTGAPAVSAQRTALKAVSASADPVLALVPADRRRTLIAVREPGSGNAVYRLDIHLQGDNETVFFDV